METKYALSKSIFYNQMNAFSWLTLCNKLKACWGCANQLSLVQSPQTSFKFRSDSATLYGSTLNCPINRTYQLCPKMPYLTPKTKVIDNGGFPVSSIWLTVKYQHATKNDFFHFPYLFLSQRRSSFECPCEWICTILCIRRALGVAISDSILLK